MKVMNNRLSLGIGFLLSCLMISSVSAQDKPKWFDPARHLSIDKVHRGMKGYGLTIFYGTKIERFNVKVIDIVKNYFEPKRNAILIELRGCSLERTGVIEGMSGSPVYMTDPTDGKDKIIGAVAFGWPLPCPGPAICGVQPIEEMMIIGPDQPPKDAMYVSADRTFVPSALKVLASTDGTPRPLKEFDRFCWAGIVSDPGNKTFGAESKNSLEKTGLTPLAIPLGVSGVSNELSSRLASILSPMNLSVVKAGSAAGGSVDVKDPGKLQTAGVLALPIVSGDITIAAVGTVTDVSGDRIWGFGHSLFAQGPIELPLASGVIHTIVPNMMSSFKLGSPFKPIGTLYSDQKSGVAGRMGTIPKMVPMDVRVNFAGEVKTFHYDMAIHEKLSPLLVMMCIQNSVVLHKELPEYHTVRYKGEVEFEQFGKMQIDNVSSDSDVAMLLAEVGQPINLMMNNNYQRVKFKSVKIDVDITPRSESANIKQAKLDKNSYKPGDQVRIDMLLDRVWGPEITHSLTFTVPNDLPDGEYDLTLGGMRVAVMSDRQSNPYAYRGESVKDIFEMIRRVQAFRSDRFYVSLNTQEAGLGFRQYGMRQLPGSKLQQLQTAEPNLTSRFTTARIFEIPSKYIIDSELPLKLVISRNQ